MKGISTLILIPLILLSSGCGIKTATQQELYSRVQLGDSFIDYPLVKPDTWFGDKSNEYTIGQYRVDNFDSSFTKIKTDKDEEFSVSWKRALINGHLIESIDDIKESKRKKFSFKLLRDDKLVFSANCRILTNSQITRDSVFVYHKENMASLSCLVSNDKGSNIPYQMNNSWHRIGADLSGLGINTVVIQPEFNQVTTWDDGSTTTSSTGRSGIGFSLKDLDLPLSNPPIGLLTIWDGGRISLNKNNKQEVNDLATGLMMIQYYYVNYLDEMADSN